MKIITRLTAIAIAGIAICYLGLSGYVWYHDNQRSKEADVQASTLEDNNKILGFLREKGCDYCHTPLLNCLFIPLFPLLSS
ncbi:cytochrome C peroxidase [Citrobacter koseri]|uniref:Cytochrome C peroxidase n=1 Tax=Citrobacter koseri TaxID=545 RepID=A0A2X2WH43_CITKO|nr:cytochrome C peroxidase [Citrobacter koseri]